MPWFSKKILALVIAVRCLSMGFAAFASTLNIITSAHVNPINTFKALLSSETSTLDSPIIDNTGNLSVRQEIPLFLKMYLNTKNGMLIIFMKLN